MTWTRDADLVKVPQEARNDAADYLKALGYVSGWEKDQILRGKWDKREAVQWFARRALLQQKGSSQ